MRVPAFLQQTVHFDDDVDDAAAKIVGVAVKDL